MPGISRRPIIGKLLQVFAAGLLCIPSLAQTSPPAVDPLSTEPQPGGAIRAGVIPANAGTTSFLTLNPGGGPSMQQITGQPYSLELESTQSQTLADGTHISRKGRVEREYRVSQGRTRNEHEMAMPGLSQTPNTLLFIRIEDPVAHVRYMLDTRSHIARSYAMKVLPNHPEGDQPWGMIRPRPAATPPPNPSDKPRPVVKEEPLGTQTFEGVLAEGIRITTTIPVDWEGNDRPIETVCERWFSTDLKLIVMFKCSDPRRGDNMTRLTHAELSDPDPSLFRVPPGYKIIKDKNHYASPLIQPVSAP